MDLLFCPARGDELYKFYGNYSDEDVYLKCKNGCQFWQCHPRLVDMDGVVDYRCMRRKGPFRKRIKKIETVCALCHDYVLVADPREIHVDDPETPRVFHICSRHDEGEAKTELARRLRLNNQRFTRLDAAVKSLSIEDWQDRNTMREKLVQISLRHRMFRRDPKPKLPTPGMTPEQVAKYLLFGPYASSYPFAHPYNREFEERCETYEDHWEK